MARQAGTRNSPCDSTLEAAPDSDQSTISHAARHGGTTTRLGRPAAKLDQE